ncbi:MAG: triple tyrosine motif-containing protein [Bacteroidia bacterium]
MLRIGIITILFAGILISGQSQIVPLPSHSLTPEEGLSQSTNSYIYQDSYGFVWISSLEGLNRFDGRHIQIFKPDTSEKSILGRNIQSDFFEDSKGNIWFTTEAGINCYRRSRGNFDQYGIFYHGISLKNKIHYAFYLERDRFLWVICQNNLFVFDTHQKDTLLTSQYLHPLPGVRCHVSVDAEGYVSQVLACYWDNPPGGCEIINYDRERNVVQKQSYPILNNTFVYFDGKIEDENRIWISTSQGILKIDNTGQNQSGNNFFAYKTGQTHRKITPFTDGKFLVKVGRNDIAVFDPAQNSFSLLISSISKLGEAIHLSKTNTLWNSVEGVGVEYRQLTPVTFSQPIAPNQTGAIWAIYSFKDSSVAVLANSRNTYIQSADGNISQTTLNRFSKILEDKSGVMWEISEAGLGIRDMKTGLYVSFIQTGFNFIFYDLAEYESELLIATNRGLFTFNKKTLAFDSLHFVTEDPYILNVLSDRQGRIWMGTGERLDVWERIGKDSLAVIRSYPGNGLVNHIVEDTFSHTIWVATSSGLGKINNHTLDMDLIGVKNGLPEIYLYAIVPDGEERIWLSTNQGIYCYYPKRNFSRQFTTRNGLSSREYSAGAGIKDRNGFIWFGGNQGVDRFHPDSVKDAGHAPLLSIVGLHINGELWKDDHQSIETLNDLELKYYQKSIQFDLAAMEYLDPGHNQYKVQMIGLDTTWRDLGTQNFVTYSNLNPGSYDFKFTASNAEGIWQEHPKAFHFTIHPHFTQTVWFRLLMFTLALAIVGFATAFYYRYRLNQQQLVAEKQQREAEKRESLLQNELKLREQRDRIASDIHDELGTGLSRLRILGVSARRNAEPEKLIQALKNVSELAEELDTNRRALSWATDPEMDQLSSLLARIRRESAEMFEALQLIYRIDIDEIKTDVPLNGKFRLNMLRIVKELLTNVARHAKATSIDLQILLTDLGLKIILSDDGEGISASANLTGKGIRSIRKRVSDINGTVEWLANTPQGTKVIIEAPYPKAT